MGQKDLAEKILLDYNDVFADIINNIIYDGKDVVKEDALENTSVHSEYRHLNDGKLHEEERDVIKRWKGTDTTFALFGVENQTAIDKNMILRVMGYEGSSYQSQYHSEEKKPYPVITFILYYGKGHWTGARYLSDIIDVSEEFKPYFNDHKLNVIEIGNLPEEQRKKFKSDFKHIADFIYNNNHHLFIPSSNEEFKHTDAMLKALSVLAPDERYKEIFKNSKEVNSMCWIMDEATNRGIEKGIEQGKIEMIKNMHANGMSAADISKYTNVDLFDVQDILGDVTDQESVKEGDAEGSNIFA